MNSRPRLTSNVPFVTLGGKGRSQSHGRDAGGTNLVIFPANLVDLIGSKSLMILITGCRTISRRGHSSGFKQVPRCARRRSTAIHILQPGGPNWTEPVTLYRWQIEDPTYLKSKFG